MTAQTADEIINKYLAQTGGAEKWATLKTLKSTLKIKTQGMDLPATSLSKAPNAQKFSFSFQGKEIVQECFDGKEGWSTNFMTMAAEKMEAEDSENKSQELDFPDPFIDYAKKGYSITLEGEETVEGTVCHKIKLTKKPMKVDGKTEENFAFYFFDKENNVPIMSRSVIKKGQMKGVTSETFMSDYQEVNGLFFPFTIQQKMNGELAASVSVEKIEVNPEVKDGEFAMPK
ncbi:MAG: outer membrane lipoprotein-sorting protein [Saprospiraceae bacterium]|nr:outer membrane lipoprotein-sorting protein [Saprospiraceae bacterium]